MTFPFPASPSPCIRRKSFIGTKHVLHFSSGLGNLRAVSTVLRVGPSRLLSGSDVHSKNEMVACLPRDFPRYRCGKTMTFSHILLSVKTNCKLSVPFATKCDRATAVRSRLGFREAESPLPAREVLLHTFKSGCLRTKPRHNLSNHVHVSPAPGIVTSRCVRPTSLLSLLQIAHFSFRPCRYRYATDRKICLPWTRRQSPAKFHPT